MLIYDYQVQSEIELVRDIAKRILEKYPSTPCSELLKDTSLLKSAYTKLIEVMPEDIDNTNITRHLHFTVYNLERDSKNESDMADIVRRDLPNLQKRFIEWTAQSKYIDAEFAKKVGVLLKGNHLNAAIREAFVILKERMVSTFALDASLDGRDLVNKVFGKQGVKAGKMPDDQRESLRNLLDGLYGVFRNKYSHNDVAAERYEVDAVLSSVNWALKEVDRLK